MKISFVVSGVLLLSLAAFLEMSRQIAGPRVASKVHDAVLQQVVWRPDSSPSVQGES